MCERGKLRIDVGNSKVRDGIEFQNDRNHSVRLNGEELEEVKEFKYQRSTVYANGEMEVE